MLMMVKLTIRAKNHDVYAPTLSHSFLSAGLSSPAKESAPTAGQLSWRGVGGLY